MLPEDKYFATKDEKMLWERYCGFFNLSLEEFMSIQRRLLVEQIGLVSNSFLGKKIMNHNTPRDIGEFRKKIPLTTYEDYEPYLSQQREDVLVEKPYYWCHSAGRGGYFKWVPYTHRGFETFAKRSIAANIIAAAKYKGDISFRPGVRMLLLMPPRPYTSGSGIHYLSKRFTMKLIPPSEDIEKLEFSERVATGFKMALSTGVDVVFSLASVLVKAGESMSQHAQRTGFSVSALRPKMLLRMLWAFLRCKITGRTMLPRDLWKVKSIVTGGPDVGIYMDRITHYWGTVPYTIYGATEAFPLALQGYNRKSSTFIPDIAFWEFIPEHELYKANEGPDCQPTTVLFNEVEPGKTYELVLTHFYGMPFLRYRMKDLVTFVGLEDKEAGIKLPQMVFKGRIEDAINLGGLTRLDEKTLWQAIENSGLEYEDWSARKEYAGNQVHVGIYLELKKERAAEEIEKLIHNHLKEIDVDYRDVEAMLGVQPIRVTLLPLGTFQRYYEERRKEEADLARLKPPHMNASDEVIQKLVKSGESR